MIDLDSIFDNADNHTTTRTAEVWPAALTIFIREINTGVKLKNEVVAKAVREMVPGAKTTAKSIASYRSKRKDDIIAAALAADE